MIESSIIAIITFAYIFLIPVCFCCNNICKNYCESYLLLHDCFCMNYFKAIVFFINHIYKYHGNSCVLLQEFLSILCGFFCDNLFASTVFVPSKNCIGDNPLFWFGNIKWSVTFFLLDFMWQCLWWLIDWLLSFNAVSVTRANKPYLC